MNATIPSFSDIEDEDEEEIQQVQPVVTKPKPKSYAKFEPILKRKIHTLKENPFEFEYGEKMDEHYLFVLQLMQRADEKYMEPIDIVWIYKQLSEMVGDDPDKLEDLEFIMNYLHSLANNIALERISQIKSDQLLQIRMRQVRLKVDELDRAPARKTIQHAETVRKRKNGSRWDDNKHNIYTIAKIKKEDNDIKVEEPDRFLKHNDSYIGDIFAKSPSPQPQPSTPEIPKSELECDNGNEAFNKDNYIRSLGNDNLQLHTCINKQVQLPTKRQQLIEQLYGENYLLQHRSVQHEGTTTNKIKQPKNKEKGQKLIRNNKTPVSRPTEVRNKNATTNIVNQDEYEDSDDDEGADVPPANLTYRSNKIKSSNLNASIAHTSHSGQKKLNKSCLKQYRRSDTDKILREIQFIDLNCDNEGKSATNPTFKKHITVTLPCLRTLRFTIVSKQSKVKDDDDHNENDYKIVPSSDHKIIVMQRENPMTNPQQKKKIQSEINSELFALLNIDAFFKNRVVRYMFLVDSIMTPLKKGIFTNLRFMHMGHPRMPQWFIESLDTWWTDSILQPNAAPFYFHKIFICLGMDINIYFADPKAKPEQHIMDFLKNLNKWFETKLDEVRRNYNANKEKSRHLLKFQKYGEDEEGKPCTLEFQHIRLAQKPKFVLITVPEVGHWRSFFFTYNNQIRNFVNTNSHDFLLLDWDGILKSKPPEMWDTVEKRTRILLEEMNSEHGVLYE